MSPSGKILAILLPVAAITGGVLWFTRPKDRSSPSPPPQDHAITGCVGDGRNPLAGVRVRRKGTAISTLTDAEGRFRLPFADAGRITAWKEGYLIAGTAPGSGPLDLRLVPLPQRDNPDYTWVDPAPNADKPGNCANCHAEIYREWALSGHSQSASGRRFRNLYEGTSWDGDSSVGWGLLNDYPVGAGVCASCHAPAIPDGDSDAQLDLRRLSGVASRGVHCDYCHKIADVGDGKIGLTHGRFNLRLLRPKEFGVKKDERSTPNLFFGPLDDVDRGDDAYSPLYRESRYCASCHEGVVFSVRVYTTYSEWLDSPARKQGKQCQDCHMTPTGTMTNIAPGHGGIERDPQTLGNHRFLAPDRETMLRRSVRLEAEARRTADGVRASVRIGADNVGHRVPTGFIDRHLILSVEALDTDGKPLAATAGPKLPAAAGAELKGRPGRLFAKLLTGRDGKAPAPFWLANGDPEDNRLTPDRVELEEWTFPPATAKLRVRMLYRRFWAEVVRSKGWPDQDTVIHELMVTPR